MTRIYTELVPTDPDWTRWSLSHVLRRQARERSEETFLIVPEETADFTFGQTLDICERIAGGLRSAGAERGDRLVIMGRNGSAFVHTWFATALADVVEAPINTAYEGDFLRHQVRLVEARWVVVDAEIADRFIALGNDLPSIEGFWVIGHGDDPEDAQQAAIDSLRSAGWLAAPWEDLLNAERLEDSEPDVRGLTAVFFISGTTGLSKGVAMPHAHMNFFAEITRCLTRFTHEDTWLATTPLFHGNAQYMAVYPALIAGEKVVVRRRFSASRWVDQLREHQVTVTNFLGVMMDFVYKQPRRPDDADNSLRCVFAAPTASSILEDFK